MIIDHPTRPRIEVPNGCSTEEMTRLKNLMREVLRLPKEETKPVEKKAKRKKA